MSAKAEIGVRERRVLRTLDAIGGEVAEAELVHHCGPGAVLEAFELAERGFVIVRTRTTFELVDAGREAA